MNRGNDTTPRILPFRQASHQQIRRRSSSEAMAEARMWLGVAAAQMEILEQNGRALRRLSPTIERRGQ